MFQGYLKDFPEKLSAVLEDITGVSAKVFNIEEGLSRFQALNRWLWKFWRTVYPWMFSVYSVEIPTVIELV